jgi:hypothetical protein
VVVENLDAVICIIADLPHLVHPSPRLQAQATSQSN